MSKKILVALCASLLLGSAMSSQAASTEPKREFRSSWVAGMGIDWPRSTDMATAKAQLIEYLDQFENDNFTGVCIHVRPRADAYYKSTLEPWSADLTGTRGKDPGWDPLAFAIEECHKRGLECYAWINPYRVNANSATYTTSFDKQWDANGWLIRSGKWTSFNPGLPAARRHCLDVIKEIYTNYMIDGMLFDDYFYPGDGMQGANGTGTDADADDYELWKNSGTKLSLYDWRRNNVNTFVQELYNEIQAVRPDLRFGIGPAGVSYQSAASRGLSKPNVSTTDWQYDDIYADCLAWLDDGSIDFIAPQIYWSRTNSTAPYEPLATWWNNTANYFGRHNYVSLASYKLGTTEFGGNNSTGWSEIGAEIDISRNTNKNNAPGAIYYNTKSVYGPTYTGLGNWLGNNRYTHKVLVPTVTWKKRVVYSPVTSLAKSGTTLTWNAAQGAPDKAIIRYTVYAVPEDMELQDAKASDGDGIDAQYLLGVSYATSYTLPTGKRSGYWYAVCIYDGLGYESEPAMLGYSIEHAPETTLISPANGAQASWDQTFTWSAVSNATYTLQVASDVDFTNIVINRAGLTSTTKTEALDILTAGKTYYWRVVTSVSGMLSTNSASRSFVAPKAVATTAPTLLTPADKTTIEDNNFVLSWRMPSDANITKARVEICHTGSNFSTLIYSNEVNKATTSITLSTGQLGKGSYDWRVVACGARVIETASAARTFTIEKVAVGSYEPGYTIKNDGVLYGAADKYELESVWYRSVESPWDNLTFDYVSGSATLNRGMAANTECVYVSGRSANSSTADIYLDEYNGATGEHIRRINLSTDGRASFYPCNDVIKDSKGNICIASLSINIASTPVVIHKVNLTDGSLTKVATLSSSSSTNYKRVDHVGIYGDVDSGDFYVFAAAASTSYLLRWHVTDAESSSDPLAKSYTYGIYPSSKSTFGIAPKVRPISATQTFVDGGASAWSLYDITVDNWMIGSFENATNEAPIAFSDNGGAVFKLGDQDFMVYNYAPATSDYGCRFSIAKGPKSFTGLQTLWRVPGFDEGLGTDESSTCSAPVDAVTMANNMAYVYIFSPGNGLACYKVKDGSSGVENIVSDGEDGERMRVSVLGRTVMLPAEAANVTVYATSGAVVLKENDVRNIELPASGMYIINADGKTTAVTVR